ncbi:MAG: GNAT family N-acetyltransferase, partial [Candidatus Zixiibacteriota bacterium]
MKLEIHGTRINLRPPKKSDAATIYSYARDAAISRHTFMPHPYTIKDAHEFIRHSQSTRRKKVHYHFGIEDRETGGLIGMIALMAANDPHHKAELGYWVGRKHWGQGIATEAINL